MKKFFSGLVLIVMVFVLSGCGSRYLFAQKTYWGYLDTVSVVMAEYNKKEMKEEEVKEAFWAVEDILFDIEKWFSIEQTPMMLGNGIDKSELMEVNDKAGVEPVVVSPTFIDLLKRSIEIYNLSDGYFNPAIGPLSRLWDISGKVEYCMAPNDDSECTIPPIEEISAAMKLLNPEKIVIDEEESTVFLEEKGMKLDFGGIAKGYAADLILDHMKSYPFTAVFMSLGGNVYIYGEPNDKQGKKEWYTAVENPLYNSSMSADAMEIGDLYNQNVTVVTSGIYKRYIYVGDVRYSHLLDANTGYPFESDLMSVTIIGPNSAVADALATGVYGLGIEKGYDLVKSLDGYGVIFVTNDKKVYYSNNVEFKPNPALEKAGYQFNVLE